VVIARITEQGLTSIAVLVVLLWTCVIGERMIVHNASAGAAQTLIAMRALKLKNRQEPVAAPVRRAHPRRRTSVG